MSAVLQFRTSAAPIVDREKFETQGFVTARGVIDCGLLESLLAEMDELFAIQLRRLGLSHTSGGSAQAFHINARKLLAADVPSFVAAATLCERLPATRELMSSDTVLRIARELGLSLPVFAAPVRTHIISDGLKIPGRPNKSSAHQDAQGNPGSADGVTLWAPLTAVSIRTHPLEVAPRSHQNGLIDPNTIDEEAFVPLPMQPGDVVVLSRFLVHRTGERGDGSLRVAISSEFNNAADPPFADALFA